MMMNGQEEVVSLLFLSTEEGERKCVDGDAAHFPG